MMSSEAATYLFVISGILISILPFIVRVKTHDNLMPLFERRREKLLSQLVFLAFNAAFLILAIRNTKTSLLDIPIDYHNADMIPQIKVCCQRLLAGQQVYAPISEIWNGLLPSYFPAMWLPYLPFEFFGIDVRWTSLIFLFVGFIIYFFLLSGEKQSFILLLPVLLLCQNLFHFLFVEEKTFIAWVEEPVVIGYYLFLGFALIKKNPWLIGSAMALCLLSRYLLIFWIPVYLTYAWFFESRKFTLKITATLLILFLLIFLIPFGIHQPEYFFSIPSRYLQQAINLKSWNSDSFAENIGFAQFFPQSKLHLEHTLVILSAFLIPLCFLGGYLLLKNQADKTSPYFGLCSLKMTMVAFYAFIEIPFYYLFFVSAFFTIPIIFCTLKNENSSGQSLPQVTHH